MKPLVFFCFLLLMTGFGNVDAQELSARVTVNTSRIGTAVNKNVFLTLQNALNNFLNNRKWTGETYAANEKISCSFLLNLEATNEPNVYNGQLTIQAARPVYNTSYFSPLMNFQDENIAIRYVEFQQMDFNENRVSGSDALASNLTALFAYYAYMIIGFDSHSFSIRGGDPYFQKAQNIVNNAPEGRGISGWKAFDGIRNRYWLVENMLNSRYAMIGDIYYNYYRLSLDQLYEDDTKGRTEMLNVLNLANSFNTDNPNTMIMQFFFQGKANELIKLFSKANTQDKMRASELLQKLDLTNANRYKTELK